MTPARGRSGVRESCASQLARTRADLLKRTIPWRMTQPRKGRLARVVFTIGKNQEHAQQKASKMTPVPGPLLTRAKSGVSAHKIPKSTPATVAGNRRKIAC